MNPSIISIQPIGEYFQNDENGFVINPASWDKIPSDYHNLIDQIKQNYLDQLNDKLHSVYLRGSLVRGLAVRNFSDIDSFALVTEKGFRWKNAHWSKHWSAQLNSKFNLSCDFEFMLSSIRDDLTFENPNVPMLIKTQSICIFGNDLTSSLPKFKPDKKMMLNYRWIASDLEDFNKNKRLTDTELKEFLKVLIRSGFEIVMTKEGKFTPDLYLCVKSFSKYFPAWQQPMEKALFYYLNPHQWKESDRKTTLDLTKWLIEKVKSCI